MVKIHIRIGKLSGKVISPSESFSSRYLSLPRLALAAYAACSVILSIRTAFQMNMIIAQRDAPAERQPGQPPEYHLLASHHGLHTAVGASCRPDTLSLGHRACAAPLSHDTSPGVARPWLTRPVAGNILSREKSKVLTNCICSQGPLTSVLSISCSSMDRALLLFLFTPLAYVERMGGSRPDH
jgi:hypothetical protein